MHMRITVVPPEHLGRYCELLSTWRISRFRDFPYLYEGTPKYEEEYFKEFCAHPESVIVRAHLNDETVALLSALPLRGDFEIIQETGALSAYAGIPSQSFFYIGEVIVQQDFQGRGLARMLLKEIEEYAACRSYSACCFLTVVRDENDPRKPSHYTNPDVIWTRLGYEKTSILTNFHWPTRQIDGTVLNTANELVYWLKILP